MNRILHPFDREEVMAYLDGELSAEHAARVAAHLAQCADCEALASDLRLASQQLTAWQLEPAPPSLTERVTAAIEERSKKSKGAGESSVVRLEPERRPQVRRWVLTLAGALGALGVVAAVSIPSLLRVRDSISSLQEGSGRFRAVANKDREEVQLSPFLDSHSRGGAGANQAEAGPQRTGPMVVRTATLNLVTKDFDAARATVERLVREHHGYIAELGVTGRAGAAHTLTATLRVPADQLDAVLRELKKLGRVEQESQGGEEVTERYVDLTARLSNAHTTEQRLIEVLRERTGKVADILAVEQEIARVREDIERMTAERKGLENRVVYATLNLKVSEEYRAEIRVTPASTRTRLWNAMADGYRSAAENVVDLMIACLRYGPTLILTVIILYWPLRELVRRLRALER